MIREIVVSSSSGANSAQDEMKWAKSLKKKYGARLVDVYYRADSDGSSFYNWGVIVAKVKENKTTHLKQGLFKHSIDAILEEEKTFWGDDYNDAIKSGELNVELIDTREGLHGIIEGKFRLTNAAGIFEAWWNDGDGPNDINWVEV